MGNDNITAGGCRQYTRAMKGIRKLLLLRTSPAPEGLLYVAEKRRNQAIQDPKMDHLVCFLPGKHLAPQLLILLWLIILSDQLRIINLDH